MLFDVAHADALTTIQQQEDRLFLEDQRSVRSMIIGPEDKKFTTKQKSIEQRRMKEEKRRIKEEERRKKAGETSTSQSVSYCSEYSSAGSSNEASEDEYRPSLSFSTSQLEKPTAQKSKIKHQLLNSDVSSALDRNKTSDREAVRLMIPMAAALGHDPMKLPLSRSTIQRARKRTRRDVADSVRHEVVPSYPLVVHWDEKAALPDMLGGKYVERLPVLVSGDGNEKLLGVPKMNYGTGENEANAVYSLLEEWKLTEKVHSCLEL